MPNDFWHSITPQTAFSYSCTWETMFILFPVHTAQVSICLIVWIIQSNTPLFFLIITPGYMFRSRGPSSGLLCCHDTDPNFIYVTFSIPVALQRIWHNKICFLLGVSLASEC
jgi:hypothetical protein